MSDVGVWFTFRVEPGPATEQQTVAAMRGIFEAMAAEEFPTGDVKAYTAFIDRSDPGRWVMFEHFTARGSERHAKGPLMREAGDRLSKLFVTPYERLLLEPVLFAGCGEAIDAPGSPRGSLDAVAED